MALGKNMKIDRLVPIANKTVNNEINTISVNLEDDITEENQLKEVASQLEYNSENEKNTSAENSLPIIYTDIENETIKISFKPSRRKTQKRILIDIEGSITINNVELMHAQVRQVFDNYDFVEVTLKNITDIDLTAIQLFHAIRVSYYPQNKFISINAELSSQDRKLLNSCGFTEFQTQVAAAV